MKEFKNQLCCSIVFMFFMIAGNIYAQENSSDDPVMLLHVESNEVILLIDQMESLEGSEIIVKNGSQKWTYDLEDKGRKLKLESLNLSDGGWILLRKNNTTLASITLSEYINSTISYIEYRQSKMRDNDLAKGYTTEEQGTDDQKEEDLAKNDKAIKEDDSDDSEPNRDEDIVVPDENFNRVNPQLDDFMVSDDIEDDKDELAAAKAKEEAAKAEALMPERYLSPYEIVLIHDETFAEQKPFVQVSSRRDLSDELVETADFMETEYKILENYGSWLMVQDKRGKEFAFTGSELIKFNPGEFMLKFEEPDAIKSFLLLNHIAFIPESKKWIGVYCQNHYLGAIRSNQEYSLALNGTNVLMVSSSKSNYSIIIGSGNCTVVYDEGRKTKSYPLYGHRGHFSPRNWNISQSVLTSY